MYALLRRGARYHCIMTRYGLDGVHFPSSPLFMEIPFSSFYSLLFKFVSTHLYSMSLCVTFF
jgi:hypothetical protein